MKKKYWIALGESSMFTRDDHYVFNVFYTGQPGTSGASLFPKFVEANSLQEVREKLHAFIDERLDHEIHMHGLEQFIEKKKQKADSFKSSEKVPDSEINQLSIGDFVGEKPTTRKSDTEGILNLEDLL